MRKFMLVLAMLSALGVFAFTGCENSANVAQNATDNATVEASDAGNTTEAK